jgi:hypothetical protein
MDPVAAQDIATALRDGLVPRKGLDLFSVGLEPMLETLDEELDFVARGKGRSKWIRGEYGSGKTFTARMLATRARAKGFASSEVQISVNDTPLHHLETVYRRLVERLQSQADGIGAFQAIVDGWLYQVGEEVRNLRGIDESDPSFADATEERLEDKLAQISRRNSAFAQVLRAYHRAQHEGDFASAQGLLGWLAGQPHADRSVTKLAGVKGKVDGQAALTFLSGVLILLRQSGYHGLVVVLDEVETIQRMNSQTREKSLNALRQLMDGMANDELPGLYLVVTGTPDFFEGHKGLKGTPALYQRVHVDFSGDPRWDNHKAPQVRLTAFDRERLLEVGKKVREIYPAKAPERVGDKVDDDFLAALVDDITAGFGGHIEVTPRTFLRKLVDVMDRVDRYPAFDPVEHYELSINEAELEPQELAARKSPETTGSGEKRRRLEG